jgi:hypothetical protein
MDKAARRIDDRDCHLCAGTGKVMEQGFRVPCECREERPSRLSGMQTLRALSAPQRASR